MEGINFQEDGGIFAYPDLKPVRFFLNYDPPQIGLLYKRTPKDKKKHMFLIQLNGDIVTGDAEQVTQLLFDKYPAFLNKQLVNPGQIYNLVCRLLEYIRQLIMQQQYEEDGQSV